MSRDAERLSFPDAPRIVVPPPGPRSRALLEEQARLETEAVGYPHYLPIAPHIAQGKYKFLTVLLMIEGCTTTMDLLTL